MQFIINFFEYTISGWLYVIWFILMIIFSLACLGVVGDKVSKKKLAELKVLREKTAEDEYKKAHELIEKQTHNAGVESVLDPDKEPQVKKELKPITGAEQNNIAETEKTEQGVVVLDAPVENNPNQVVDNITPIVNDINQAPSGDNSIPSVNNDNANNSNDNKKEEVPAILVINDDGTSNT